MCRAAVIAVLMCAAAAAQTFEVASVQVYRGPLSRIFDVSISGPRVTYGAFPILGLVMEAYDVKRDLLMFTSLPPDANTAYYNIVAKAEGNTPRTRAEFRRMLQSLLADRFRLKIHWEGREMPVYALVPARNGPKLRPTPPDVAFRYSGGANGSNQTIDARSVSMEQLAREINSRFSMDRPVIDRTGLAGVYDVKLEATPEDRLLRDPDTGGVSIFTAIQRLGLKLEPRKDTVQVLVIDHVEMPTAN
jgi:uncharacterized protein (TIGR03435 family)